MRQLAFLALAALLGSGCFVIDELDGGLEDMREGYEDRAADQPKAVEKAPDPPPAARGIQEGPGLLERARNAPNVLERAQQWWAELNKPPPPPPDPRNAPVRCILGDSLHFTQRDDCLLRGGTVREVPRPEPEAS